MEYLGVALVFAQRLPAGGAVLTRTTGESEPWQGDPVARRDLGHPRSEALDNPHTLVAGDERRFRLDWPVAVRGVDVGVAQTRRLDPHHHLARPSDRLWHILDNQRLAELMDYSGFHGDSSFVESSSAG
jgi:hypothetical protein